MDGAGWFGAIGKEGRSELQATWDLQCSLRIHGKKGVAAPREVKKPLGDVCVRVHVEDSLASLRSSHSCFLLIRVLPTPCGGPFATPSWPRPVSPCHALVPPFPPCSFSPPSLWGKARTFPQIAPSEHWELAAVSAWRG